MGDTDVKDEVERMLDVPPKSFWIHRDGGPVVQVYGLVETSNQETHLVYSCVVGSSGYSCPLITFLDQFRLVINPKTLKPPTSCREVSEMEGFGSS
jgi:hypothetical protein